MAKRVHSAVGTQGKKKRIGTDVVQTEAPVRARLCNPEKYIGSSGEHFDKTLANGWKHLDDAF